MTDTATASPWLTATRSLLRHLSAHGFACSHVDNGEGWEKVGTIEEAAQEAACVDSAWLSINGPDERDDDTGRKEKAARVWLVYGNSREEMICDWSTFAKYSAKHGDNTPLCSALRAWTDKQAEVGGAL